MGIFELYCAFCAGPLCDAREAWRRYLLDDNTSAADWPPADGKWRNPPGYPVPSASIDDILSISAEDGAYWKDWVCVSPRWKEDWVSPPCTQGDSGTIYINGSSDWQDQPGRYVRIHRGCLSFLCRRVNITPRQLWESLYETGSDYLQYGEAGQGLLYCLKYYDMEGRNGQEFGYAIARQTAKEDDPETVDRWDDPDTMEDTAWLLSRPMVLPIPEALDVCPPATSPAEINQRAPWSKVFGVPELFNAILSAVVDLPLSVVAEELLEDATVFDPPSLVSATGTTLALCEVNHFFHDAIIRHRQGLFLRLAWQYGWVLPSTPMEWEAWKDGLNAIDLRLDQSYDWRSYLLMFLRKEDRHVKNRWRMHRMSLQYARGRARPATESTPAWRWNVGELGIRGCLSPPQRWSWE
ncbi:hypothetical protein PUNSTDRAFT_143517 [Punctularia strigosozonata HHB-11173 SS5]|uniref:uncharacterized protein n=1 Tax=Punctularia strigosozonata (strain HHB-11173) TaxID=741275 RepID=UPI0004416266|nr:uncharacterized protein PUNSTDRAFT_143517 [Punctularia strigosozonata HHB-11173 SS5]EIN08809.1 hypothetical protein PUNSTDRAFT_143517 [Punctularia strigosozonata HHB-11173 SS5]